MSNYDRTKEGTQVISRQCPGQGKDVVGVVMAQDVFDSHVEPAVYVISFIQEHLTK